MLRRIDSRPLTAAQIHDIRTSGVVRDTESEQLAGPQAAGDGTLVPSEVYRLPGGRVAWIWGDEGVDVEHDAFASLFRSLATYEPRHLLRDYPGFTKDFTRNIPALIEQLAARLGLARDISVSVLDFEKVSRRVRELGPEKFLEPGLFEPLTAYVGEHMRKQRKGRWSVEHTDGVYEPCVVIRGERYPVFKELYEALDENDMVGPAQSV